jgi:hypothetical protein
MTRHYTVGLPVSIAVAADGSVTYTVHAEDATEAIQNLDSDSTEHTEAQRLADAEVVEADLDAHGTDRTTQPTTEGK